VLDVSAVAGFLLVAGLVVVLLWFALGTQRNIRKGNALLSWLQGGLPVLGPRTTLRWVGSTAVIMNVVSPVAPFREAEVLIVLEPRDVAVLWAWARSRRRRDFLILRARLKAAPTYELEAGSPLGWTGEDRLRRLDQEVWERTEWDDDVRVAHSTHADLAATRAVWKDLEAASGGVWRLSVRREPPNLEIHILPPVDPESTDAVAMFETFRRLAATVSP
jgi:hypothetical protein